MVCATFPYIFIGVKFWERHVKVIRKTGHQILQKITLKRTHRLNFSDMDVDTYMSSPGLKKNRGSHVSVYVHINLKTPVLVRSLKLSRFESG